MHMKKSVVTQPIGKVKVYPFTVYKYFYDGIIHLEEHPDEIISNIFIKDDIESTLNISRFMKSTQLEILCVIDYFCSLTELMLEQDTRNYRIRGLKTILSNMNSNQLLSEFVSLRPFVIRNLTHLAYLINNCLNSIQNELLIDPNKLGIVVNATRGSNKGKEKVLELIDLRQLGSIPLKKEIEGFILYLKNNVLIEGLTWDRYLIFIRGLSKYCIDCGIFTLSDLTAKDNKYLEKKYLKHVHNKLTTYISSILQSNDLLRNDLWDIRALGWDKKQNNKAGIPRYFKFNDIVNSDNKYLLKLYCFHLMEYTSYTLSTVMNKMVHIRGLLNYLNEDNLTDINIYTLNNYKDYRHSIVKSQDYLCHEFLSVKEFFKYLQGEKILTAGFNYEEILSYKSKKNYKITAVDNYIIYQLFDMLEKIRTEDALIFLIIYSTGCRISEACQLGKDAVQKINNICSIIFYTPKMTKEVINPIPENLYHLLLKHAKKTTNKIYLFETKNSNAYSSRAYSQRMKKYCLRFGIKNDDGTPYKYTNHAFRHTIGKKMMDLDIPYEKIANILHHASYEMTHSYVEYSTDRRIRKMNDFYNSKDFSFKSTERNEVVNIRTSEYMREMKNAQLLPNGICARLVKTGICKEANRCLTCRDYRTSAKDLPVHKFQLQSTQDMLKVAKKNNWLRQVEKCNEMITILQKIINQLEAREND